VCKTLGESSTQTLLTRCIFTFKLRVKDANLPKNMNIKHYGHSCFSFKTQNTEFIVDPFITGNPLAAHVNIKNIKADFILVTHGHQDHILDVVEIAKNTDAKIISNFEIATWFENNGLENLHSMNFGGTYTFQDGTVKMVPALHSSMLPDGSNGGNPAGFIIKSEGNTIYYAGDTGLSMEMELIGRLDQPDLCILPIGDTYTMGVEDAIICSDMVRCNKVIGMHYDSFPQLEIDKEASKRKFAAANKELILMTVEETLVF
jgi:L-ascorbate metabolism protein UlaG (beta-lactamase superfamily)